MGLVIPVDTSQIAVYGPRAFSASAAPLYGHQGSRFSATHAGFTMKIVSGSDNTPQYMKTCFSG